MLVVVAILRKMVMMFFPQLPWFTLSDRVGHTLCPYIKRKMMVICVTPSVSLYVLVSPYMPLYVLIYDIYDI